VCKKKFDADPAKYVEPREHEPSRAPAAAEPPMTREPARKTGSASPATVKDVVCGMDIDPKDAVGKVEYPGKTYYFCSDECKAKFEKAPTQYVK
jgi:YHS domain-containing protein